MVQDKEIVTMEG